MSRPQSTGQKIGQPTERAPNGKYLTLALLAGGKSSRFQGMDKQFWLVDGKPLGRLAAENLLASSVVAKGDASVMVVCGKEMCPPEAGAQFSDSKHRLLYEALSVQIVVDEFFGIGPLAGLHAALKHAQTPWVYLVACDMPCFSDLWLDFLLGFAQTSGSSIQAIVAEGARRGSCNDCRSEGATGDEEATGKDHIDFCEPFHALYTKSLLPYLERYLESCLESDGVGTKHRRSASFADFLSTVPCLKVPEKVVRRFTPDWRLFSNINTRKEAEQFS